MFQGKKRKMNDHGFTLVEVLVTVAILGIAIGAIGGFMVVGARSFSSTSSEVNLQYESQLAYNQLQDLIVDAQLGITQAQVVGGSETIIDADTLMDDAAEKKKITIYNGRKDDTGKIVDGIAYVIIWDNATDRLYYEEYNVTADGSGDPVLGTAIVTNARMADWITDFDADLSKLESKSIVSIHMAFQKENKSYDANYNITVRNKVLVNKSMKDTYTAPIKTVPATTIEVNSPILVEPGSVYNFPAPVVKSSVIAETPSQEVRWFIDTTNAGDSGTTIDVNSGKLKVSESESHDTFQVKVQSADGAASNYIEVKVRKITGVGITYKALSQDSEGKDITADKLTKDAKFQLNAAVTMNYNEELTTGATGNSLETAKTLKWEIKEGEEYLSGASSSNLQWNGTMKSIVTSLKPLRVRATAVNSMQYAPTEGKYGEWTGTTFTSKPDFVIVVDSGVYERGQEYNFNIAGSRVGYIYLFASEFRRKMTDADGKVTYEKLSSDLIDYPYGNGSNVKIKFPLDLNPYDEYEVDIRCYEFATGSPWSVQYGWLKNYGYNIADATGESWIDTIPLKASDLYFDNVSTLTKTYTPRKFSEFLNGTSDTMYTVGGISNFRMSGDFNINQNSIKWNFYTNPTGGAKESDFTFYAGGYNGIKMFKCEQSGANLRIDFTRSKWDNSIPEVLYLVPTIYVGDKNYFMYHTYVKVINHNITVTKNPVTEKLYFPYPLCGADGLTNFPGKDLTGNTSMKDSWYRSFNFNDTLQYDLQRYETQNDGVHYTLTLWDSSRTNQLGIYDIKEGQISWTKK